MVKDPPRAEYAVLTVEDGRLDVDLRRVPVDRTAIRQALLDSGRPHTEWWAADWRQIRAPARYAPRLRWIRHTG
jgi:protein phosphatase